MIFAIAAFTPQVFSSLAYKPVENRLYAAARLVSGLIDPTYFSQKNFAIVMKNVNRAQNLLQLQILLFSPEHLCHPITFRRTILQTYFLPNLPHALLFEPP
jgi:hypothetical protein